MSAISLENVYFKYDREGSLILNNINMVLIMGILLYLQAFLEVENQLSFH